MRKENLAKTALVAAEASTKVTLFTNDKFGTVRTTVINGEPWFVGKDVADILGYKNPSEAIQDHVDKEDKFIRSARGREMLKLFSSVKDMQDVKFFLQNVLTVKLLHVERSTVAKWESGTYPRASKLEGIARALNCSVDDLLCSKQ